MEVLALEGSELGAQVRRTELAVSQVDLQCRLLFELAREFLVLRRRRPRVRCLQIHVHRLCEFWHRAAGRNASQTSPRPVNTSKLYDAGREGPPPGASGVSRI